MPADHLPEPTLRPIAYDAFLDDLERLAQAIEGGGWQPEMLVGIARGGLVPATYLSHRLALPMLSIDLSAGDPVFGDGLLPELARRAAQGCNLLLVDDINDSGGTIARLRTAILRHGGAADRLRFGVLIDNLRSAARVDYRGRTIDRATTKDWFVFPWEAVAHRDALVREANSIPSRLD